VVDNHHLFGKSEIGTHSSNRKKSEPKRRLLDLDESDEILNEEDELDAELSRLMIEKLSICNL